MAVLAPIPRAMVRRATMVKPGLRSIPRAPNLKSERGSSNMPSPFRGFPGLIGGVGSEDAEKGLDAPRIS